MKAQVKWTGDSRYLGLTESNNSVIMDCKAGEKSAASPMEMVLMGIGGCSTVDIVSILQKARQNVTDCHVEIESERAESVPAVFTRIHLHFVVKGRDVKDSQVERAVNLSADKYCSVSIMLGKAVEITHSFEVVAA